MKYVSSALPLVSIIIPVLNEIETLPQALKSLVCNEYPLEKMEFIIVDGGSSDGTLQFINTFSAGSAGIKIFHNSKKITPAALNIAIEHASYDVILRVDAHAHYYPGYIEKSVKIITTNIADNVGGIVRVVGSTGKSSECIALAMNSVLGNGGVSYRGGKTPKYVETVWCGCWNRQTLIEIGGFNEKWIINQDFELNFRLRRAGKRILFSPYIRANYYCRSSLKSFAKQYFRYGQGRAKTMYYYPRSSKIRHFVAVLPLIVFLIALSSIWLLEFYLAMPFLMYMMLIAAYSAIITITQSKLRYMPRLFVTFLTMHIYWGSGLIKTLVELLFQNQKIKK